MTNVEANNSANAIHGKYLLGTIFSITKLISILWLDDSIFVSQEQIYTPATFE